ncbi:MAG: hypothetical protein IRY99_15355, partial [Isosphaeraceae bacterium]|nr:hypothetical protein [Isosphaeraceae bacterium]
AELDRLARRLAVALGLDRDAERAWSSALPALMGRARLGIWAIEARLLYDLQNACIDHERQISTVDLVEWALTLGRRPIRRALPHQREVRLVRHLRAAGRRLRSARLADADRDRLAALLHPALEAAEARLRDRTRPAVERTLDEVGLVPGNTPERVARRKLVEELLDRVVAGGYLTMGDLRDALSRNQLKLPDLAGPVEFVRGDRLLKANRRLAVALDGVYRRGEVYLRWLQRFSAAAFGTRFGRFLTLYLALPYGGAYVTLEGLQHIIGPPWQYLFGTKIHLYSTTALLVLGTITLGLLHVARLRAWAWQGLRWTYRVLRTVFVAWPRWMLNRPWVRRVLESAVFRIAWRSVLEPLLLTMPLWAALRLAGTDRLAADRFGVGLFLALCLLFNTRSGRDLQEITTDALVWFGHRLATDLLPGLFRLVMETFDRLLDGLDRLLYTVDEWLRFRSGEGPVTLAAKAALGVAWFVVAYVVRFCVNLLIEPQVNPIKHFPVVTVAHKLTLPFMMGILPGVLTGTFGLGRGTATGIAGAAQLLVPGVFGFLVWELKENWRLYEANRPATLRPVIIGAHGETMGRLLRPGLHSGTVPKHFARLRRAERRGRAEAALKHREALHHVEQAVRHFAERELIALWQESHCLDQARIAVDRVELATNRVRIELAHPDYPGADLVLAFEEQSGWLLATLAELGWLAILPDAPRRSLATALAGLYKLAGVDLVREQLTASLSAPYDIAEDGLLVWPGDLAAEALYDLRDGAVLAPRVLDAPRPVDLPLLDADRLIFRRRPIAWRDWVAAWDVCGPPERVLGDGLILLPGPEPTRAGMESGCIPSAEGP